jgi:Family of unknown function (DUF6445)
MRFIPSRDAQLTIVEFGKERTPVIRIDNVSRDASALVRYACESGSFAAVDGNLYPGVRAAMPLDYVKGAITALDPLVRRTYNIGGAKLAGAECFFSIVTTPPDRLVPFQKIPHIDTTDPLHFAVVHYLCGASFGGTGFFRQAVTDFETITPERENMWSLHRDAALNQLSGNAGYIDLDPSDYQQIGIVDAEFDRLVLYPSNLLHSGIIPVDMAFSADPAIGRLTANYFIEYRTL